MLQHTANTFLITLLSTFASELWNDFAVAVNSAEIA